MKRLSILLLTVILSVTAQFSASAQEAYQFRHLLEVGYHWSGFTMPLVGVENGQNGFFNGAGFNVRYNYFFHKSFAGFVSFNGDIGFNSTKHYFSSLEEYNGEGYDYSLLSRYPDSQKSVLWNRSDGAAVCNFAAGIVYRFISGRFSMMPRLGVGLGLYDVHDYGYWKYDNSVPGAAPVAHLRDYDNDSRCMPALTFCGGLQLNVSVSFRVFLFAEGGVLASHKSLGYTEHVYGSKSEYHGTNPGGPSNWLESALSFSTEIDTDNDSYYRSSRRIGCRYNARAGVGVYLGRRAK